MASRYSSNFGNKLQIMVGIGKDYGFQLNFDMPKSFTQRKSDTLLSGISHQVKYGSTPSPFRDPYLLLWPNSIPDGLKLQRARKGINHLENTTLYLENDISQCFEHYSSSCVLAKNPG